MQHLNVSPQVLEFLSDQELSTNSYEDLLESLESMLESGDLEHHEVLTILTDITGVSHQ